MSPKREREKFKEGEEDREKGKTLEGDLDGGGVSLGPGKYQGQ